MAALSIKELSKRNNFSIFTKRISIGQGFYLVGMDELITLSPSILEEINCLEDLYFYKEGNSIVLPTTGGNWIRLSRLYKDSEFSNRTQNTTIKQDLEVYMLSMKIEEIKKQTNSDYIKIRIKDNIYKITGVVNSPFGNKSDFNFIDINNKDVGFISHKWGNSARDFQQWSGTSKRFQEPIFIHDEVQNFIYSLRKTFNNELPKASTVARKLKDNNLKLKAMFGIDYGNEYGLNNVEAIMQGNLSLKNIGDCYLLRPSHVLIKNGEIPEDNYEPVIIAIHKKDRNDHGIMNARITINPIGGRRIKTFI